MNIQEGNKLIAEFMGGKTSNKSRTAIGHQNIWLPFHGICRWDTIEIGKGKILEYHSSWDWLMPVLEKITQENHNVLIDINVGDDTTIYNKERTKGCTFRTTGTLDNTWRACVYFIQKQNENTSSLQST